MFGLCDEFGCNQLRVRGAVGEHEHLARTGDHIDLHVAANRCLCRGHPAVPRPDDDITRREGLGAVREARNRLRTTDLVDGVGTGDVSRRERRRRQLLRGRCRNGDVFDTGHVCRDDPHQRARRVRGGSAGDVHPGAGERPEPPTEFAAIDSLAPVRGALVLVERPDVRRRLFDRRPHIRVQLLRRPRGLVGHVQIAHLDTVELTREPPQRDVSLLVDTVHDIAGILACVRQSTGALEYLPPLARTQVRYRSYLHLPVVGTPRV